MSSMRSASSMTRILTSVSRMRAPLEHVDQPAGCGDQHVHATHQHVLLVGHAFAADDQRMREFQILAVLDEILRDLQRQLTCRLQDQAARHPGAGAGAGKNVQQRQGEAGGLAGARLCRAQHVTAHQHERDCLLLDRGGVAVSHFFDRAQHGFGKAEIIKQHTARLRHRSRRIVGQFRRSGERVGQILVQSSAA